MNYLHSNSNVRRSGSDPCCKPTRLIRSIYPEIDRFPAKMGENLYTKREETYKYYQDGLGSGDLLKKRNEQDSGLVPIDRLFDSQMRPRREPCRSSHFEGIQKIFQVSLLSPHLKVLTMIYRGLSDLPQTIGSRLAGEELLEGRAMQWAPASRYLAVALAMGEFHDGRSPLEQYFDQTKDYTETIPGTNEIGSVPAHQALKHAFREDSFSNYSYKIREGGKKIQRLVIIHRQVGDALKLYHHRLNHVPGEGCP